MAANFRVLVESAILLALIGVSCQSHRAKSNEIVSVDLTKLQLRQIDASLPAQISLVPIKSVRLIPLSLRSRIPKMSNPGGPFNPTDVTLFFDKPRRRLIFGGVSDQYCLVHYEYGGIAHGYMTALFELSGSQSKPLWAHAGARYASLEEFAKETGEDELSNEIGDAVF